MAQLILFTGELKIRHRALVLHGSFFSVYETKEAVLTLEHCFKILPLSFWIVPPFQDFSSSHKSIFCENTYAYIDATGMALMSHLHSRVLCCFSFVQTFITLHLFLCLLTEHAILWSNSDYHPRAYFEGWKSVESERVLFTFLASSWLRIISHLSSIFLSPSWNRTVLHWHTSTLIIRVSHCFKSSCYSNSLSLSW